MSRDVLNLKEVVPPNVMTLDEAAQWIDLHPSFGWNLPSITKSDVVGLGLAMQCAMVAARDIAKTELRLWKRDGDGWRIVGPKDHDLARLLARRPNPLHTWTEFWQMTITHLKFAQNAYVYKVLARNGDLIGLVPLMPSRVRMRVSAAGNLFYEVSAATEFERMLMGQANAIVPANRMIHFRGRMIDGMMGLSSDILGNPIFKLLDAISNYQTGVFHNDGKQPLVFEMEQNFPNTDIGETAFRRLKSQLGTAARASREKGDPLLLEAGLKAKNIAFNAKDSMTAEAFNQQVGRICGLMEMPPHKIFHYESVKYENMTAADNLYANDCLVPTAKLMEELLGLSLLTDDELDDFSFEFDRLQMVAGDPASMQKWVDVGLKNGALSINEARERFFQVNPIEGGNVRLVPVNMSMVDEAGTVVAQGVQGQVGNDGQTGQATPSGRSVPELSPAARSSAEIH